jgi:hypothetical protein
MSYLRESKLYGDPETCHNFKPIELLQIIKQLSRERKYLMLNLLASIFDVGIGL